MSYFPSLNPRTGCISQITSSGWLTSVFSCCTIWRSSHSLGSSHPSMRCLCYPRQWRALLCGSSRTSCQAKIFGSLHQCCSVPAALHLARNPLFPETEQHLSHTERKRHFCRYRAVSSCRLAVQLGNGRRPLCDAGFRRRRATHAAAVAGQRLVPSRGAE